MLTLAYPWALAFLILPWFLRRRRRAPVDAPVLPTGHWLAGLPGVRSEGNASPRWYRGLLLLLWLLLVLAIARPQWLGDEVRLPMTGRDLMLVVDISPSMNEQDMSLRGQSINRLQAVKHVLDDFITRRDGDRLGLILFGSEPYVQAPLTFDVATVRTLMQEAGVGMAGRATAIGDAIGLAVKRLRDRPQDQRVVILLTDGANTAGELPPDKATDIAAAAGVRLYTIGIGADSMIQRGFLGSRTVNPSRDLDEALLTHMAEATGGQYFRARDLNDLNTIYGTIDQLEPIEQEGRFYRPVTDLFWAPAGLAAGLVLAIWLVSAFRHRRPVGDPSHG